MNKRLVVLGVFLVLVGVGGIAWSFAGGGLYEVQSGSMEPTFERGDVLVGVQTESYERGDVILWESGERVIVHRVALEVERGEDWVSKANPEYLESGDECRTVALCPAPTDGYVTLGDNKGLYDQANARFSIVTNSKVRGEVVIVWER